MEEGGGGLAAMGWRTEEAGVSRLVERAFSRPWSMNGESDGWAGGGANHVSVSDALVFGFFEQKMGRACLKFGESTNFAPS